MAAQRYADEAPDIARCEDCHTGVALCFAWDHHDPVIAMACDCTTRTLLDLTDADAIEAWSYL